MGQISYLRRLACAGAFGSLVLSSTPAPATPRAQPFSYPHATLFKGELELEQFVDLIPMRVPREDADGTRAVTALRSELQTEFEYGLSDQLELGFYLVFRQGASATTPALRFQGVKQRLRYRFAAEGDWPIDVGVYGELAEYHNELEFEQKLLLSRRFGRFTAVSNLWVEQEYYFQTETWKYVYNPTVAASYELSPSAIVGVEYWARGRFDDPGAPSADSSELDASGTRHYLGPTLMVQGGGHFITLGTYLRLDHLGDRLAPNDPWGKVWVRILLGVGL